MGSAGKGGGATISTSEGSSEGRTQTLNQSLSDFLSASTSLAESATASFGESLGQSTGSSLAEAQAESQGLTETQATGEDFAAALSGGITGLSPALRGDIETSFGPLFNQTLVGGVKALPDVTLPGLNQFGLFDSQQNLLESLGQQAFSGASASAAGRGQLSPENLTGIVGSALQNIAPTALDVTGQNIKDVTLSQLTTPLAQLESGTNVLSAGGGLLGPITAAESVSGGATQSTTDALTQALSQSGSQSAQDSFTSSLSQSLGQSISESISDSSGSSASLGQSVSESAGFNFGAGSGVNFDEEVGVSGLG